jgi:MoaA/NifB/PqqE/SkfB family radical SAM enzyme
MNSIEYLKLACDFFLLKKDRPYILGLVITDLCNLNCKHCHVANIYKEHMPYSEIKRHLITYYSRGARFLYLEGGEPYLWEDNEYRLEDIVQLAKRIGYLRVHIYTNGAFPLTAHPHFTWVSMDGLAETYRTIRGIPIERVLNNLYCANDQRLGLIYTVNTINSGEIQKFLSFVHLEFPKLKVMFFFHTPYYGIDSLFLSEKEKRETINTIIDCKRKGLPVLNSEAGLRAITSGLYNHPMNISWVVDQTGEYQCCRAYGHPEVCKNCGYSSGAEIDLLRSLRPSVVKEIINWC